MRKIINLFESETKIGNIKVVYKGAIVKENLLSSIISDTYTFGVMIFSFWVNHQYIQSKVISILLLIIFLFNISFSSHKRRVSTEEFKKIMNEYIQEVENETKK